MATSEATFHFIGKLREAEAENQRLTEELAAARIWHEKAHTFLEERNDYKAQVERLRNALEKVETIATNWNKDGGTLLSALGAIQFHARSALKGNKE